MPKVEAPEHPRHPPPLSDAVVNDLLKDKSSPFHVAFSFCTL